jgi:hypothetical protein
MYAPDDRGLRKLLEIPLFGLVCCRYPRTLSNRLPIRRLVRRSKRQPPNASLSSNHGRPDGLWADALWRQKRIRHDERTCVRLSSRSRCAFSCMCPIWHLRVVADPSSNRRQQHQPHATPGLDRTVVSVGNRPEAAHPLRDHRHRLNAYVGTAPPAARPVEAGASESGGRPGPTIPSQPRGIGSPQRLRCGWRLYQPMERCGREPPALPRRTRRGPWPP